MEVAVHSGMPDGVLDIDGIDAAYGRHFDDLVRLCRALGGGPESEDIAQETLLFARMHVDQLRDTTKTGAWLRVIAARKTRKFQSTARTAERGEYASTSVDVYAPSQIDLGLDLASSIARLPARERHILALVHGLGYSQQEAADALGIRRGTVAASLFHARKKLAAWLIDYERKGKGS